MTTPRTKPTTPLQAASRRKLSLGFVLLPHFTLVAFSTLIDILRLSADEGDRSRPERCSWSLLAPDLEPVTSSCGIQVKPWETFSDPTRFDYIVVVGGLLDREPYNSRTLAFMREAHSAGVRLIGICTGGIALAEAGLMRGRRCCVSWYHFTDLVARHDDVIPVADQLFVEDGPFITCAGGLASLDLGAWLIDRHLGPGHAQKSLHIMVTDRARPAAGAQPQPPSAGIVEDNRVRRAMLLIEQNLSTPQRVEKIAQTVGLSKRQLERVFRKLVGKSVQEYSRDLRVLYGRWLLANSPQTITEVATECGFSDVSHFNRLFRRSFGCSPSTMRRGDSQSSAQASEEWDSLRAFAGSPDSQGDFHRYLNDEPAGVLGIDRFLSCERRPYAQ
ncbi:GlxA family transcriptional regulator [Methylobacterium sp. J-001]|uniref:GlxA family transcriptional regulator n=1 Tax=unclassified Methylobacterium TaxID=2615210 RepID=UPI001FBB4949|nr:MULTISPECIES: GlxA family transcriptional regulator [unclassified Methylobacterium]MCJ2095931.1 GlxA family transcriptional regulator [Methylobacterium sp. J-072]MCJ2116890.1 GlxA family transcriptional regulator [Methylobacterium sp. J-001]